jgi:hypothetical protein
MVYCLLIRQTNGMPPAPSAFCLTDDAPQFTGSPLQVTLRIFPNEIPAWCITLVLGVVPISCATTEIIHNLWLSLTRAGVYRNNHQAHFRSAKWCGTNGIVADLDSTTLPTTFG